MTEKSTTKIINNQNELYIIIKTIYLSQHLIFDVQLY